MNCTERRRVFKWGKKNSWIAKKQSCHLQNVCNSMVSGLYQITVSSGNLQRYEPGSSFDGIPMCFPRELLMVNILEIFLEKQAFDKFSRPYFYVRYVDDTFAFLNHTARRKDLFNAWKVSTHTENIYIYIYIVIESLRIAGWPLCPLQY